MQRRILIRSIWLGFFLSLSILTGCAGKAPIPFKVEQERALDRANLGIEWLRKGCYSEAFVLFEESLRINQSMDNQCGVAHDYDNLGVLALRTGEAEKAKQLFAIAMRIQQGLRDNAGLSLSLSNLASVDLEKKNYEEAEKHLREAYQAALSSEDELQKASVLNLMGRLYWQKGLLKEAKEHITKAIGLYTRGNRPAALAAAYHNLGLVRLSESNTTEAQALFDKALELDQEFLNYPGMASDLEMLSQLCLKDGKWPEAVSYAVRAFNIFYNIGDVKNATDTFKILEDANQRKYLNDRLESFAEKLKEMSSPEFDLPCRQ